MWLLFLVVFSSISCFAQEKEQKISPIDEKRLVTVDPKSQNIPSAKEWQHIGPPKPRIDNEDEMTVFIGLSAFRDGYRCGNTIFTAFKRASFPSRVYFGIVDQRAEGELACLDAYCRLAQKEWPEDGETCRYKSHIRVDNRKEIESRGPTFARSLQQHLVAHEDFCLQLDAHSVFTNKWDKHLIEDWKSTDNEMAVLSTYLHDLHDYILPNGDNNPPSQLPHLCKTIRGGNGLVRNSGASMLHNPNHPQMSALWGAGLSFSKCHAERRALVDPYTLWMFDGEEFLRSSHLWTYGYDIYSPSRHGAVVYHNYTSVPKRFESVQVDPQVKTKESEMGRNRFKVMVGLEFKGMVDTNELEKYHFGKVRTFEQYLNFSGVTFEEGKKDQDTCHQLHWVPYTDPKPIEELLQGWTMGKPRKVVVSNHVDKEDAMSDVEASSVQVDTGKNLRQTPQPSEFPLFFALGLLILFLLAYTNDRLWSLLRTMCRRPKSASRQY